MNHISVFLNDRIVNNEESAPNMPIALGDWCLTPVRCLFNGNKVTVTHLITRSGNRWKTEVKHEKEYDTCGSKPRRNFLRVAASIGLIIPGVLLGGVFKGLGHLSQSIPEPHNLAVLHYTPHKTMEIGSRKKRLKLEEIKQRLSEIKNANNLNRPVENLVIFAQEGTTIGGDPGFMALNPQKIILVGARLINGGSLNLITGDLLSLINGGFLDNTLANNSEWESKEIINAAVDETYTCQWKVNSVEEAFKDIPPKISLFSSKRYNRVYIV